MCACECVCVWSVLVCWAVLSRFSPIYRSHIGLLFFTGDLHKVGCTYSMQIFRTMVGVWCINKLCKGEMSTDNYCRVLSTPRVSKQIPKWNDQRTQYAQRQQPLRKVARIQGWDTGLAGLNEFGWWVPGLRGMPGFGGLGFSLFSWEAKECRAYAARTCNQSTAVT